MATLTGTSGNDTLTGTSSADTLVGSGGNDFYDGGGGSDTLDLRATSTATIVDFTDGTISGGFTGSFTSIERVLAGNGNDHLIGGAGAQNLSGRAGADTLEGGAGNDWLWGGGGGLENQYVFRETGTSNADQIGDFISGADKIVLDASVMAALGAEGNFAAGDARFAANTSGTAQDATDRVIYETDTRQIWYDPDGNGAAARQLIATLQSGATLTATDIVVEGAGTPPPGGGTNGTEGDDTLVGTPGDDTINGLGGNDSISGLDGDDSLSGGAGNDTLDGGSGADTLDGGTGDDTYVDPSGDAVNDTGGIDTVIGFETSPTLPDGIENLILRGGPFPLGNDEFTSSGDGNDLDNMIVNERSDPTGLSGRGGDDTLIGSAGTDYFLYRGSVDSGHDSVDGGGGSNILWFLHSSPVTVDFREGTATSAFGEVSFQDIQEVRGSLGDDLLIANDAGIVFWGVEGDDTLIGGSGDDLLFADDSFSGFGSGGSGNDSVSGGAGNDRLVGGSGNDVMDGGSGNDRLEAGGDFGIGGAPDAGDDTLRGGSGNDTLQGGGGADRLIFDQAPGAANADHVVGFASGEDEIHLDATVMSGLGTSGAFLAGDVRFFAAAGASAGHDADDRVVYDTSSGNLWYDADGSGAQAAQLVAILDGAASLAATDIVVDNGGSTPGDQHVVGTANDDNLAGGSGNDTIEGLGGLDTLNGAGGNDLLAGGSGWDTLTGGAGQDTFAFAEFGSGMNDAITDFVSGTDTLQLDAAAFTAIGASGRFTAGDGRFFAAPGATGGHDADDRLVYDTTSGILYYDANGNGSGGEARVAILQAAPSLAATDIVVTNGTSSGDINGTSGNDTLVGTPGDDTINGLGGNDSISGLDGNDSLSGGEDDDTLDGGNGDDTLDGGLGDDTYVLQGSGADEFTDAGGTDTLISFAGFRPMPSGIENLILRGGPFFAGNDIFTSSGDGNELDNLIINERPGSSGLDGGAGDDTLIGSATGMNWFEFSSGGTGDYGNDVVDGNGGAAILLAPGSGITVNFQTGVMTGGGTGSVSFTNISRAEGSSGADLMIGNDSAVFLYGSGGNDTLIGGAGDDALTGDGFTSSDAPEFTIGNDSLSGGAGNDALGGGRGDDTMDGGAGDDVFSYSFESDYGNDSVTGGTGIDLITIFNFSPITIDLAAGTMVGGEAGGGGSVAFTSIENFTARGVGSRITGDGGANVLIGANGDFVSSQTDADDTINGAAGNDTLSGMAGDDQFVFDRLGEADADHVTDFTSGQDEIHLDANAMSALGASGAFAIGDARFFSAAGAFAGHDADDRVVYDTASGNLWYDADGSGAQSAQLIAILDGAAPLAATDIVVINGASSGPGSIDGTAGDDTLTGTSDPDTINGLGGNDSLVGLQGADVLNGGDGNDTLDGRNSFDFHSSDPDVDTMNGGLGNDTYFVDNAGDVLSDSGGTDTVVTHNTEWTLGAGFENLTVLVDDEGGRGIGNALDNVLDASQADQVHLEGLDGNDSLIGGVKGNLSGGNGADTLVGGELDFLSGNAGNDLLIAASSNVDMSGGSDADVFRVLHPGNGAFIEDFVPGTDTVQLDATAMTALGASGRFTAGDPRFFVGSAAHDADDRVIYNGGELLYDPDGNGPTAAAAIGGFAASPAITATDIEIINGSSTNVINGTGANDTLTGTAGNDALNGLGGNDTLVGSGGTDFYDGGSGSDTLDLRETSTATAVSFAAGTISGGFSGTFANIERVLAGNGSDSLTGGSGAQNLSGRGGNDTVEGGAGNDWLWGGGSEVDTFVFREAGSSNADDVGDFTGGVDRIALDNATMAALGADGAFASGDGRFFAAAGASSGHDANDRVIYNTSTGQLYYDDDGSGAHAAQLIATLHGAPTLAAAEISVI